MHAMSSSTEAFAKPHISGFLCQSRHSFSVHFPDLRFWGPCPTAEGRLFGDFAKYQHTGESAEPVRAQKLPWHGIWILAPLQGQRLQELGQSNRDQRSIHQHLPYGGLPLEVRKHDGHLPLPWESAADCGLNTQLLRHWQDWFSVCEFCCFWLLPGGMPQQLRVRCCAPLAAAQHFRCIR